MVVFELRVFDKLFVAVAVDILSVAVVDKLEVDIRVVDILAVALLAGIGNCGLKICWMHWTYALEDATAQASNKLV
ncbi:hypothetical protein G9A89_015791 [Geosiphon pyriformis]|nr:hypothetical protein G9A89_015791 [Geosiphon pyriformis]